MRTPDNISPSSQTTLATLFRGAISSIWFPQTLKSDASVVAKQDLSPEGAICLLIMVTEGVSSSFGIERYLHRSGGGAFERKEAKILAESGLRSLQRHGYLRLDAKGVLEVASHDQSVLGLGDIQFLLTAKAARAIAPIYCSCKGLDSAAQPEAVKSMLATNKAAVSANRKSLKSS